jgi:hypothetical protein
MSGKPALSREAFERQRAAAKRAERRYLPLLVAFSVGIGFAQLGAGRMSISSAI